MRNHPLPFQILSLSSFQPDDFHEGRIISTLNQCGAFLCTCGRVELSLDNEVYQINKGDIYVYMPATLVRLLKRSADAEGIMLAIDIDFILPVIQRAVNVDCLFYFKNHPCLRLHHEQYIYIHRLFQDLLKKIDEEVVSLVNTQRQRLHEELLKSMTQTLIYEFLNTYFMNEPLQPVAQTKKDIIFQQFLIMLFYHYRNEREVTFYANKQQLSARYFSSIIKEKSGKSALQWIVQMVITEAKLLLETSELSIKEIAVTLNFPTQSFFGKYFKQYVGISPKEYREQFK